MEKKTRALELRSITEDEYVPWVRSVMLHFGEELIEERARRYRPGAALDRSFVVLDGERIVANCAVDPMTISLPFADAPAPCAGITAVGVAQDWRRRGLLRRMMRTMLDQAIERGEAFASLYASEASIYGRFGFGHAATHVDLDILSSRTQVVDAGATDDLELVDADRFIAEARTILDDLQRTRPGVMHASDRRLRLWWGYDDADRREGFSPRQHAVVPGRGFVAYRWKPSWEQMVPEGTVKVEMLVANDPAAAAALWDHVLSHDLTVRVTAELQPADTPVPFMVTDASMVRVRHGEHLHLRVLDVPTAIAARGYASDGSVVLDVADGFLPDNAGRWRVEVAGGRGRAERTEDAPDLALDVAHLASTFLGGVPTSQLVAAGRVVERTEGAAGRWDRLVASGRAPWTPFEF